MEVIGSSQNSLVKRAVKLKDKKYREEYKEFIAEGFRNVADTFGYAFFRGYFQNILISESRAEQYLPTFEGFENIALISDALFEKLSDTSHSQGVLAILKQKKDTEILHEHVLYLDRVRDPGNLGTIIRTAAAAGYSVIVSGCAEVYNPKVVRSCMSAVLKANIVEGDAGHIDKLKNLGYNLVCADMGGQDFFSRGVKINKPIIAVGSEAEGLCREIRERADYTFSLPMEQMESLNVSVCAAVMMYNLKFDGKNL